MASSVSFGASPPVTVAAFRKSARHASSATVANAVISAPSVLSRASVVFSVLLIGSSSTLPQVPVTGSTRFGALPAAIRRPNALPLMAVPLMKRALVNTEATVVSSLTTTFSGGSVPSTDISASASLEPPRVVR